MGAECWERGDGGASASAIEKVVRSTLRAITALTTKTGINTVHPIVQNQFG